MKLPEYPGYSVTKKIEGGKIHIDFVTERAVEQEDTASAENKDIDPTDTDRERPDAEAHTSDDAQRTPGSSTPERRDLPEA